MQLLSSQDVLYIHEQVIGANELQGLAANKSLDAVLHRVENRIHFGMIEDPFDLAAAYAVFIAVGHVFNDANKRTAYNAMTTCLELNGIDLVFDTEQIGQRIIEVAQGVIDEVEFARYLRSLQ